MGGRLGDEANCFKQFNVLFSWKEKKGDEK
jgi:hypothetical protein